MIIKEWLCNHFEMIFWKRFAPFSANCLKGGTHATTPGWISFLVDLKHAWKGRDFELFAPIAFNKNMQKSNKNLKVMIEVTKA